MRFCIFLLCAAFWLFPCYAAQAAPYSAVIDGMSITVSEPWALVTWPFAKHGPTLFDLICITIDGRDGYPMGQGHARAYPLSANDPRFSQEALAAMSAEEMHALLLSLREGREGFLKPEGSPRFVIRNGVKTVVCQSVEADTERIPYSWHSFQYYYFLEDRLVVLGVYVLGSEQDARQLEAVCASFNPQAGESKENAGRKSLRQGGLSLSFPRDWWSWTGPHGPVPHPADPVWTRLSRNDGEDRGLAEVFFLKLQEAETLSAPSAAPGPEDVLRRFHYLDRRQISHKTSILNVELTPEYFRHTGSSATWFYGREALLHTFAGDSGGPDSVEDGRDLVVEVRDVQLDSKTLRIVTGYRKPLPAALREELAGIYASVSYRGQEPGWIERYYDEYIKAYNHTIDLEKYAGQGTMEKIEELLEGYLLERYGLRKGDYILSMVIGNTDKDLPCGKDEYLFDGRQIGKTRCLFEAPNNPGSIDPQESVYVIRVTDKDDLGRNMLGKGPCSCTVFIDRNTLHIVDR